MASPLELVVERDNIRQVVKLDREQLALGRGLESDVRLDDPLASRSHCRIERLGGEVFVVDLDSANGTWVAGQRIQRRPLGLGDVIRIGTTRIQVAGGVQAALGASESTRTQEVSRDREMLQTLLAVMRALREEDKLERLAAMLIDTAVSLCRAERGFVFIMDRDRMLLAMGRNFAREPVAAPEQKISTTLLARALKSERPLLLEDAGSDEEFAGVASISELGLRSLLAMPLRHRGEVLGLLLVDHRLASGAFRQDELDLLAGLAGAASLALGAARDRQARTSLQRKSAALKRQLGQRVAAEQEESARLKAGSLGGLSGMVGASAAIQEVFSQIERILPSDVSVLIQGESGTGKELVAQALHYGGLRASRPFITMNCGALPDTLLESELFGHVKGTFTGAIRDRAGRFEEADGGTLFLDEVGEMSPAMQSRLLRTLQEGEVRRLGSETVRNVDVRVLSATNTDLETEVREGRFREDLYYRLKVVQIDLPPLRSREGDVALLAEHFLAIEAADLGRLARSLQPAALALLEAYDWPGNVRQLRNEIRRLTLLGDGPVVPADLSSQIAAGRAGGNAPAADAPLPERVTALERAAIAEALERSRGNRSRAAELLGITRFTLLRKVEKYGLDGAKE